MSKMNDLRSRLEQVNLRLRHDSERAEAALLGLNDQLRRLRAIGLFGDLILLGPVVLTRPYDVGGPTDTGQVVQAALDLSVGFGAAYWDSEEIYALRDDPDAPEREARGRVVPFEECEPAVRGLLADHAPGLVGRLLSWIDL